MIEYVVGFIFSEDRQRVALIRKIKPSWQAGKLNGLGGKIEPDEDAENAIFREVEEEAGVSIPPMLWREFYVATGGQWQCTFFKTFRDVQLSSPEEEKVAWYNVTDVLSGKGGFQLTPQCYWLIAMALDDQHKTSSGAYQYKWEDPSFVCPDCHTPQIECRCDQGVTT